MAAEFSTILERLEQVATTADLENALTQLKAAIGDATTRVSNDIAVLRQQLVGGGTVSDADLQAVQDAITAVGAIDAPSP